ncbi:MAG: sigma-54 dependent transcriptional regulator [Thermoanaerobaculia bacterium]|nr:sigma-54 dependent transcriptional regulator [Thermoanaerobaculia bacterium]
MTGVGARGAVLIVDDEAYLRDSLATVLARRGFTVSTAPGIEQALAAAHGVDAVVTDLKMPDGVGLDLVRQLTARPDPPGVIVLTGYGTVSSAVECMRAGASDYLLKPVNADEMVRVLDHVLARRAARVASTVESARAVSAAPVAERTTERPLLGRSAGWLEAVHLVERAARAETPVLLLGETGPGKEELAGLLHRRSARRSGPWVAVNCAALPAELFESEMFGHRRGAFTGAAGDRLGRFPAAHRGTLFLDEIDSLSLAGQAKILRVVQDGVFEMLGESSPSRADVRLVCASNQDLGGEVAAGRFRSDLFYRLNVLTIRVPPLRERREDITPLARGFLPELAQRLGVPVERLHPETLALLSAYDWPGNVRELRNVIERGLLLCETDELRPEHLPAALRSPPTAPQPQTGNLRTALAATERRLLEAALASTGGVRRDAARRLGIDERNLAYYLRKHDLLKAEPGGGPR